MEWKVQKTKPPIKSRNTIDSMVCLLENKVDRLYICGGGDKTKKTSCLNIFTTNVSQIDHFPQFVSSHTRFLWSSVKQQSHWTNKSRFNILTENLLEICILLSSPFRRRDCFILNKRDFHSKGSCRTYVT